VAKQLAKVSRLHFEIRDDDSLPSSAIEGENMKKQIVGTLVAGCLLALMVAVPARAQLPGTVIRVDIPFDFIVRGRTLPAGTYQIKRFSDAVDGLSISNVASTHHDHIMFETAPVSEARALKRSEVVFHRYGDRYFLSEILTGGQETGAELIPSHAERQLKREMQSNMNASNQTEPERVALAAY
jgi:hypothetical protein